MPKGARWEAVKAMARSRDAGNRAKCWICGDPIDYDAPPQTHDAWEPDHRWPESLFPELAYDLGNLMPSHCHCNRSRGNGVSRGPMGHAGAVEAEGLGAPSRQWGRGV